LKKYIACMFLTVSFITPAIAGGHVSESKYSKMPLGQAIKAAYISENLTNADIAWHAINTYGWDCEEVTSKGSFNGEYYVVTCSTGLKLRVYPRKNMHPSIRNINGGWK